MTTDNRLAARKAAASPQQRPFGALPPATSGLDVERALELAGVDATEFALLASTTFKEARTLEELVTLIATTRRRGLDAMLRHVYYERFGGWESDPSMHVGIDGLRAIAAATGRYAGGAEPRFSGAWDMPIDEGKSTKLVPEKCSVTVWAIVQGKSCAFEGVAFMEEAYPGTSGRGRMWRQRPRGMLAVAAERQALRRAFPNETSGINDIDEGEQPEAQPATPVAAPRYVEIFGKDDDDDAPKVDKETGEVLEVETERDAAIRAWVDASEEATRLGIKHNQPPHEASPELIKKGTDVLTAKILKAQEAAAVR